ncbi:MAG: DHHA1 domain-containing protein [archaeon]
MIAEEKLSEFRELLHTAQNPLFLFDNDTDGLSAFLLLRRVSGKGKGVAIKSFPDLNASYIRKLHEFNPDYVFILDKPLMAKEFVEAALSLGIKVVWLDHHPLQEHENVLYFNPLSGNPETNEPTSYWAYRIANKKEDMWLAMLGCIGDWFLPEFSSEFSEQYPDIFSDVRTAAQALYETQIGKIAKIVSFAMKDRTTNVVRMIKFLIEVKDLHEILEENSKTRTIYKRYREINQKYSKLLDKAKATAQQKLLFFQYAGDLSISGELANELFYNFPDKTVAVAYIKGSDAQISLRSKGDIREKTAKAMSGLEGRSGGHKNACAAKVSVSDLPKFRENLEGEINPLM